MMKYESKTMDAMDYPLVTRINYKRTAILKTIKKAFYQAYCFNFFPFQNSFFAKQIITIFSLTRTGFLSSILNLEKEKNLKKK